MFRVRAPICATALLFATVSQGFAQSPAVPPIAATPVAASPGPSYSDLVDLAESAPVIARARVRKQAVVDPARALGLAPGHARLYIEAQTEAMIAGQGALGESLRYLVDVPLGPKGKLPKLGKLSVLLFARTVPARPGELQLVRRNSQIAWTPDLEARLRGVLAELMAPGAPTRIAGIGEASHVAGNLAGSGETQVFFATASGEPASITVIRTPGQLPRWSASFSEVVDPSGTPPPRDTLAWYRLACALPPALPDAVNVSGSAADKAAAAEDYLLVRRALGPCGKTLG